MMSAHDHSPARASHFLRWTLMVQGYHRDHIWIVRLLYSSFLALLLHFEATEPLNTGVLSAA